MKTLFGKFGSDDLKIPRGYGIAGYTVNEFGIDICVIGIEGDREKITIASYMYYWFGVWIDISSTYKREQIEYIFRNFKRNKTNNCTEFEVEMSKVFWDSFDKKMPTIKSDSKQKDIKKLDQSIFDLASCPPNATMVVVNKDGSVYFGTHKDAKPIFHPTHLGEGAWEGIGIGDWVQVKGYYFDVSNWPADCKLMRIN